MVEKTVKAVPDNARNKAYNAALQTLKAAHLDEFQAAYKGECEKAGIKWATRMTAAERAARDAEVAKAKAAAKVTELLAKYGQDILPGTNVKPAAADVAFTDPEF